MTRQHLIDLLHQQECSLVVCSASGAVTTYNKKGVRDLIWLLDNQRELLYGASIADKVIGKAAAGLLVQGGVREVYADVMSQMATPLLSDAGIDYSFGELVEHIVIPEGDNRCQLERIVSEAQTAGEVESMLRQHFSSMKKKNNQTFNKNKI